MLYFPLTTLLMLLLSHYNFLENNHLSWSLKFDTSNTIPIFIDHSI